MSEFRQNVATGEWVIIAPERSKRPADYRRDRLGVVMLPERDEKCPFCPGNEHMCESPVYETLQNPGWGLRVVPNIYAALNASANPHRQRDGIYLKAGGYGRAEVLVESPRHNESPATMDVDAVQEIIKAYRYRYNELARDPNINIVNIFRNHGPGAGASLVHPHSQIIGSLVAPPHVTDQIYYAKRAYNTWGRCVYCDIIDEEVRVGDRIIMETPNFVVFCPFASKSPYEVRIFPRRHASVFGSISLEEELDLAYVLRKVLIKLRLLLNDPDYNYYIRSITTNDGMVQFYHWYMVIIPRISNFAGFELGTGIYINTSSPEECARQLREQKVPIDPRHPDK